MQRWKEQAPGRPGTPPGRSTPAAPETAAKLLIVGPEITLSGEITACDRLVVEGSVHVTLNSTRAIEIAPSGRFTDGKAEVEDADIGGVYEGELTVRRRLLIRSTGKVNGTVRYGELEIERGGKLTGSVASLGGALPVENGTNAAEPAPAASPSAPDGSDELEPPRRTA